ncbi:MAG: hypothetical protein AABW92_01180 [Nanoarchaeota archaeon]
MTELVVILSTGKGTWTEVAKLIASEDWNKIFIITNQFGNETFNKKPNMKFIVINPNDTLINLIDNIKQGLDGKISGTEVALNMVSGTGKEHMAALSALLKLGVGIRLVSYIDDSIKEL